MNCLHFSFDGKTGPFLDFVVVAAFLFVLFLFCVYYCGEGAMDTDFRICSFFLSAGLWQQANKRQLSTDSLSIVSENKQSGGG